MVNEVIQALSGWESLDHYVKRTGCLVLNCIREEEGVVAFLDYDPWILNLPTTVIEGKTYIPAQS
jgi:hypothetical protein